jgi:hypothetical protein
MGIGTLLTACSSGPSGQPSASVFAARPVLCFAAPFNGRHVPLQRHTATPSCSDQYKLTAAAVGVSPDSNAPQGYDVRTVPADPRLADIPSTVSAADTPAATVILKSSGSDGAQRYVLGPAAITRADIASASAGNSIGQWSVTLHLTGQGADRLNRLMAMQFHAYVGLVVDNRVVGAPLTLPTTSTFSAFGPGLEVPLPEGQAKALAARLNS